MKKLGSLQVGTSGWYYQGWSGIFYPEDLKPKEYLEYYAARFSCVELNASFYRLPKTEVVKGWLKRTPSQFIFCPKLSRWITHIKKLNEPEKSLAEFFRPFGILKPKLGPLLVQLPPSLNFGSPHVIPFFEHLKERYSDYRFAIEARNETWLEARAMTCLEKYDFAWVVSDSGGRYPFALNATTDFVYLRFHGPKELYSSNYTKRQLRPYAKQARIWLESGKDIWAFFNNDDMGYAVGNAKTFEKFTQQFQG